MIMAIKVFLNRMVAFLNIYSRIMEKVNYELECRVDDMQHFNSVTSATFQKLERRRETLSLELENDWEAFIKNLLT